MSFDPSAPVPPPVPPEPSPYQPPAGLGAPPQWNASPVDSLKSLVPRIKALITNPAGTWQVIAAENTDHMTLLKRLVLPLAAIPVVAGLIGGLIRGSSFGMAITSAILGYALAVGAVFLIAFIVDKLAKTFLAEENFTQSFKLVAWMSVPAWLLGVLNIIPLLGVLSIVGAIYGYYLLFVGLPILKRNPQEKTVPYFVVTILVAIVVSAIITFVVGAILAAMFLSKTMMAG